MLLELLLVLLLLLALLAFSLAGDNGGDGSVSSASASTSAAAKKKRTTKDWSKVNVDDIAKDWEQGDDQKELEHEYDVSKRIQERKGKKSSMPAFDPSDPKSIAKAMKKNPLAFSGGSSGAGPSMVFVELQPKQKDGKEWTKEATDILASKWSALLKTAHLQANTYNLGDGKLIVSIDKGWQSNEILKFGLKQWETVKITKDSKDIFPGSFGFGDDDDDDL